MHYREEIITRQLKKQRKTEWGGERMEQWEEVTVMSYIGLAFMGIGAIGMVVSLILIFG